MAAAAASQAARDAAQTMHGTIGAVASSVTGAAAQAETADALESSGLEA